PRTPLPPRVRCSPIRSSICSACSPFSWSRALRGAWSGETSPDEDAMDNKPEPVELTEEQKRSRRSRSIAIALVLAALVVLFYVITLVRGRAVLTRLL